MAEFPNFAKTKNIKVVLAPIDDMTAPGVVDYFAANGVQTVELLDLNYSRAIRQAFQSKLSDIFDVYESLDEIGRSNYTAYWLGRLSGRISDYRYASFSQYFAAGFLPQKDDVIIDAGAFDGDTGIEFASIGGNVYSFELDKLNYDKALPRAEKYGFHLENMGLSDRKASVNYVRIGGGGGSRVNKGGQSVAEVIDLDAYVAEKGLPRVDFIKMDIEGAELNALQGAANTISKWKPKMAICMYHKLDDLWVLPKYIKSLRPDYELTFFHHAGDWRQHLERSGIMGRCLVDIPELTTLSKVWYEAVLYCR